MSPIMSGLVASARAAVASIVNKYFFYRHTNQSNCRGTCLDSSDNLYAVFYQELVNNSATYINAYKKDGTLLWSKQYNYGNRLQPFSIIFSGGYLYVLAGGDLSTSPMQSFIFKLNSTDGSVVLAKTSSSGANSNYYSMIALPNGSIATYSFGGSKGITGYLSVLDSSLTTLWTKYQGGNIQDIFLSTDSSSNVYATAQQTIEKYSSTGTLISSGKPNLSLVGYTECPVAADSSGNFWYLANPNATTNRFTLLKYNSSLVYQSNYTFTIPLSLLSFSCSGLVIDSSNNMYVLVWGTAAGTYKGVLTKISPSGTVLWSNNLYWTNSALATDNLLQQLTLSSSGDLYICGTTYNTSTSYGVIAKVRADGTIASTFTQGTNWTVTYTAATVTSSSFSYTTGTGSAYFNSTSAMTTSDVSLSTFNNTLALAGSYLN